MSVCGHPRKSDGEPCQRGPNCPHHRGRGRPTKYRARYCEDVLELGREGASRTVMARELGVAMSTMQDWEDQHPAFRAATRRARELAQAWWEDQGKSGIWSREFNASAYRLQMMNRFNWGEKSSHEVSGEVSHDVEVSYDRVSQALAVLAGEAASGADGASENGGRPVELGQGDPRR